MLDQKTKEKVLKGTAELRGLVAQLKTGLYRSVRSAKPTRPAGGQDSWEPSGPGDFRKAGGAPMNGEEKGLVSCYRADMAKFEKLPIGEEKLEIGKRLNVTSSRLAAKGITLAKTMDFAGHNLAQLNEAIRQIEAKIRALNEEKANARRSPGFYGLWNRETELGNLISQWEHLLASRKTWTQWGQAAAEGRQLPETVEETPARAAARARLDALATDIERLNERLTAGTISGEQKKRLGEKQLEWSVLNAKLRH